MRVWDGVRVDVGVAVSVAVEDVDALLDIDTYEDQEGSSLLVALGDDELVRR